MTTMSIQLPDALHDGVENIAQQEGISMNQFVISAVMEKMTNLLQGQSWLQRASVNTQENHKAELADVPDIKLKKMQAQPMQQLQSDVDISHSWVDKAVLRKYMNNLLIISSVQGESIGAELLQEQMKEANLELNELSQGIVMAREE